MIRITPHVSQKYIVAKSVSNEELLWGNPAVDWHKDILSEMEEAGYVISIVYGGGRLKLVPGEKTIHVWGKSSVFGEVPFLKVKALLEQMYPNYLIVNTDEEIGLS